MYIRPKRKFSLTSFSKKYPMKITHLKSWYYNSAKNQPCQ